MKSTSAVLSSFLLFAFATISFPRAVNAQDSHPPVIDNLGNNVLLDEEYYIYSPPLAGIGLGGNDVMLREEENMLPVIIRSLIWPSGKVAVVNMTYNFKFNISSSEDESTLWGVGLSAWPRSVVVQIGGNFRNWFLIEKFDNPPTGTENWYKLRYCSFIDEQFECKDVGAQQGLGGYNLIPGGGFPFPMVFHRVNRLNKVNPYISSVA